MNFWATVRFAILCAVIFFGLRAVAPTYAIEGESMSPTFHDGGRVILNGAYRFQTPHRGDIVVFDPPYASSNPYIKRVIALPGERLSIHDGRVYINDVPLDERYLEGVETTCQRAPHCDLVIPDDYVYVLGDNRNNSSDSRYFGPIPTGNIVGEVLITIWK
jgi:signal peptidase I